MSTLTSEQYVKLSGVQCPNCQSDQISCEPATCEGDGYYDVQCSCDNCNAMWVDGLQLTHYRDLNTEDSPTPCIKVGNELLMWDHLGTPGKLLSAVNDMRDCLNDYPVDYSVSIGDEQPTDGIYTIAGTLYQPVYEAEL